MMKFFVLYLLFFSLLCHSQNLTGSYLEEIAIYNIEKLDTIMIHKYGFTRVEDIEDSNQRVYTNNVPNKEDLFVITIIKEQESCSNILSIVNSSSESIKTLRTELPTIGYDYVGKRRLSSDIILSQYVKDKIVIGITDGLTSTGAYQILVSCHSKIY